MRDLLQYSVCSYVKQVLSRGDAVESMRLGSSKNSRFSACKAFARPSSIYLLGEFFLFVRLGSFLFSHCVDRSVDETRSSTDRSMVNKKKKTNCQNKL